MPRVGSFCAARVLRVPNETSLRMVASIFLAETSLIIFWISGSGLAFAGCASVITTEAQRHRDISKNDIGFIVFRSQDAENVCWQPLCLSASLVNSYYRLTRSNACNLLPSAE